MVYVTNSGKWQREAYFGVCDKEIFFFLVTYVTKRFSDTKCQKLNSHQYFQTKDELKLAISSVAQIEVYVHTELAYSL